jgi:RHS repeat-associated protein
LPAAHFSTELFSLAARVAVDETHVGAGAVSPEKPHQGVASKKPASHQAEIARNSTTALGLSWSWQSGTAPGARVTYDYDAWGNAVNTTGSTPNVYLYRGEQYDSDLKLYYLRARYLNPLGGRFLTRDPETGRIKAPATLHKYLYGSVDPVNRLDPSGRENFLVNILIRNRIWVAAVGGMILAKIMICEIWESDYEVEELAQKAAEAKKPGSGIAPTKPPALCGSAHDEWPEPWNGVPSNEPPFLPGL